MYYVCDTDVDLPGPQIFFRLMNMKVQILFRNEVFFFFFHNNGMLDLLQT